MQNDLVLEGARVRLEPLAAAHVPGLIAGANDPALWEHTFGSNPFTSVDEANRWVRDAQAAPDVLAFAIVDRRSGAVAGSTRYLDISPEHRRLEIGWTFLAQRFWRTHVNTESKFLLLRHAFEQRHALRVQLKAEAVNARSRAAILRLGARYEGTFRKYRIRPGDASVRDVSFYSVIDEEWPAIKARLLSFLDRSLDSLSAG
ncbi:MAG TPA: GNAT family protein [Candidatus Baltobacteraceae bacterium]